MEPSRRKMEVLRAVNNGVRTSEELASELGIKKGNARERLSEYRRQGLVGYDRKVGYDGTAPYKKHIYHLTGYGKSRLNWLRKVEETMKKEGISWREAYEKRREGGE